MVLQLQLQQEVELLQKLADTEAKIETTQQLERQRKAREAAEDDLDDFMSKMSRDKFDKTDIRRLRVIHTMMDYIFGFIKKTCFVLLFIGRGH